MGTIEKKVRKPKKVRSQERLSIVENEQGSTRQDAILDPSARWKLLIPGGFIHTIKSEITIRIGFKMTSRSQRAKQHPWPSHAWKTELAATLSLDSPRFGGMASLKTTILGQLMIVEVADLCL
jgi:hypothetical protein